MYTYNYVITRPSPVAHDLNILPSPQLVRPTWTPPRCASVNRHRRRQVLGPSKYSPHSRRVYFFLNSGPLCPPVAPFRFDYVRWRKEFSTFFFFVFCCFFFLVLQVQIYMFTWDCAKYVRDFFIFSFIFWQASPQTAEEVSRMWIFYS